MSPFLLALLPLATLLCLPAKAESERHIVWKSSDGTRFAEAVELRKTDPTSSHVRYLVLTPGGNRAILTDSFILDQAQARATLRDEETGWWARIELDTDLGDLGPLEDLDAGKLIQRIEVENPNETIRLLTKDGFSAEIRHRNFEGGDHAKKLAESLKEEGAFQEAPASLREEIGFLKALADRGHLNEAETVKFLVDALFLSIDRKNAKTQDETSGDWELGSSLPWSTGDSKTSARALKDRFRSLDRDDPWTDRARKSSPD